MAPEIEDQFLFARTKTTPLPNGLVAEKLLASAQINFETHGVKRKKFDDADELLKHTWRVSFIESKHTENIVKDLYWWVFNKLNRAAKKKKNLPMHDKSHTGNVERKKIDREDFYKPRRGIMPERSMMKRRAEKDDQIDRMKRKKDRQLLDYDQEKLFNDDAYDEEIELRKQKEIEIMRLRSEKERLRKEIEMDTFMMDRIAENYVSLFQKIRSDAQALVENDDPLDDMDDGMFPEDMSIFKMEQKQLDVRARVACDQLIGAIPDAIAQALYEAFCKSSRKMVDRFTSENLKRTLYDVCSVMISGMRPTVPNVKHWMNEQDRQKARTNALGSSQLLGDSSKLGVSRRGYSGGGRKSPHRRGTDRKKIKEYQGSKRPKQSYWKFKRLG